MLMLLGRRRCCLAYSFGSHLISSWRILYRQSSPNFG